MTIVQINTFSSKSTGSIMINIHNELLKNNIDSYVAWGRGRRPNNENEIKIGTNTDVNFHGLYTRITDKTGFASKNATKKFIKKLDDIKPDIIHLHNIHGYYINIEILFNYIKKNNIKVIWTLHDCWAFTGHCPHFEFIKCNKWKECCKKCPQLNVYPKSFIDNSKWNYLKKKELFSNLDITFVTPSHWLANLVKQSFLKNYEVKVIPNGIDTSVFKFTESNFRDKYKLLNKKIILGVASDWTELKGLNDFIKLSKIVDDNIAIVLVGLNNEQCKNLPNNIIGIKRTESTKELAQIYSAADMYFNPTYADTYPTTNLESLFCETPVVTYNYGGSPESITNDNGVVTNFEDFCNNYKMYLNKKYFNYTDKVNSIEKMFDLYFELYKDKK